MSDNSTVGLPEQGTNMSHLSQQVFLLEDTVMTMSMAVTTISRALARWERVILPMMLGFILLAAYGFYLIFSLVNDIGLISSNVAQMTFTVNKNMSAITEELKDMKHDVSAMSKSVTAMQQDISNVSNSIISMRQDISKMSDGIQNLNLHVGQIDYSAEKMSNDLWDLSRDISGPMSTINHVMPWQMLGGRSESTPPKHYYAQPPMQYFNPQVYTQPAVPMSMPQNVKPEVGNVPSSPK